MRGAPHSLTDVLVLAISASIGAILSVIASLAFTVLRVRSTIKEGDGILGDHEYAIADLGLQERTSVNETLAKWNGIKGVQQLGRFAFIELVSGSFHVIPRASFKSSQEEASFLSEVQRRAQSDA